MIPNEEEVKKYIFEFREYLKKDMFVPYVLPHKCKESEIQGVKEALAMKLERNTGNKIECVAIVEYQDGYERGLAQ